ncbi:MAG TPA: 3'(2'),5'-bisphosphate nucleotidase CysQ [Balneolaceae bacterium]|nr:3'(2'),5'-bisphosphate nucleotidase CysQ [Balneolaceae bacterium]
MFKDILALARQAGAKILEFYDEPIQVHAKSDQSPLTLADLAAHHVIVNDLEDISPDIPVISEEGGIPAYEIRKEWSKFWLVDPLDGTKEFINKNGEFTVNIALIEAGKPVFGVVYVPVTGVCYYGAKGEGSFKSDKEGSEQRIFSEKPDLSKPVTIVSSRSHGNDRMDEILRIEGIEPGRKMIAGSSLKFCLVAEGIADIYPRFGPTMEWDTAAGDAVFRYSGRKAERPSALKYNKESLLNGEFMVGRD